MYKLRTIAKNPRGYPVEGLTVPREVALFFENVYFHLEVSGNALVYSSGVNHQITKKEIDNYTFTDCRI